MAKKHITPAEQATLKRIGRNIKLRREALGGTTTDFAERAQVTRPMLRLMERGEVSASVIKLLGVANALGCGLDDLVHGGQ